MYLFLSIYLYVLSLKLPLQYCYVCIILCEFLCVLLFLKSSTSAIGTRLSHASCNKGFYNTSQISTRGHH